MSPINQVQATTFGRISSMVVQSFIVGIKKGADRYMMPCHRTAAAAASVEPGALAAEAADGNASVSPATEESALFE